MNFDEDQIQKAYDFAKGMRIMALKMAKYCGKAGCHIGGGFSSIEIIAVLYGAVMRYDVSDPEWEERDRFVPSKKHCVLANYPALVMAGFLEEEQLYSFHQNNGILAGYPRNVSIGLEYSGGSLGMGISVGIGMALYARTKGSGFHTYVLLGDGECNEGEVWEGFMAASKYKLDNLTVIIDYNNMQFDGTNESVMPVGDMRKKLEAFAWTALEVDGHSIEELWSALHAGHEGKPLAVIARTVKARGIPGLENTPESHHAALSDEAYEYVMNDILEGKYDRVQ